MDRQKHLEEILEIEDCEVREEESYYYDDEFIESLGIEKEEYRDFMFQLKALFAKEKVCFFISTNEKYDKSYFNEFTLCELNKNTTAIHDLYALSQCDRIIGPHSSFSRWASFIGDVPLCYIEHGGKIVSELDFSLIKDFYHFRNGERIRI